MLPEASTTITLASSAREIERATSGRPAPASTVAVTWATASRNALVGASAGCEEASTSGPLVVGPDDDRTDADPDPDERDEDEEAHERRADPLPPAAVGRPRRDRDQGHVRDERQEAPGAEGDLSYRQL